MHRRERTRCRRPPPDAAQHGYRGSLHRSDLLYGTRADHRGRRQRPPGLPADVRPHGNRPPRRRHPRLAQQARAERAGHGDRPSGRRQCRFGSPDRIRDRPPQVPRPRPHAFGSCSLRSRRDAVGYRRLHARSHPIAAPRRAGAGRQEGERHLLDDRSAQARGARSGDRTLSPSGCLPDRAHAGLDTHPGADAPSRRLVAGCGRVPAPGALSHLSGHAAARRPGDHPRRHAAAVVALALLCFGRLPDLHAAHQRRQRHAGRQGSDERPGISALARRHHRSRDLQRAGGLLRAGNAAGARTSLRERPPPQPAGRPAPACLPRCAATSWTTRVRKA